MHVSPSPPQAEAEDAIVAGVTLFVIENPSVGAPELLEPEGNTDSRIMLLVAKAEHPDSPELAHLLTSQLLPARERAVE